jgi:transcription initiation factor TFIIH subunit 4
MDSTKVPTVFTYLLGLHPTPDSVGFLDDLYGAGTKQSATEQALSCKAIFESLGSVAQQYVMRLLWLGNKDINARDLGDYVYPERVNDHLDAVEELIRHRVLVKSPKERGRNLVFLNSFFAESFKFALTSPLNPMEETRASEKVAGIGHEAIEKRCAGRWNVLLDVLIHPENMSSSSRTDVTATGFFRRLGLIAHVDGGAKEEITAAGYEYLLKPKALQIWSFVYERLEHLAQQNLPDAAAEVISLLFKLAYCQYGKWYTDRDMTGPQKHLLTEFAELGIVFREKGGSFFPTNMAISMLYESSATAASSQGRQQRKADLQEGDTELQLVTETTFQVTAYLDSDLHFEMIQLFMDIELRMPGMTMGRITRGKAMSAFKKNITAVQIIAFLMMYAHPSTLTSDFPVPANVCDQIKLWENETFRIKDEAAVVYDMPDIFGEFSLDAYNKVVAEAELHAALVWKSDAQQMVAVKEASRGHFQTIMEGW